MNNDKLTKSLPEYLPEFFEALTNQINSDEKRWGDTWKNRPLEGQEDRIFARFKDYKDQLDFAGTPIPWLKVAGEALIAYIREKYLK